MKPLNYDNITKAIFRSRHNRFIAEVKPDGGTEVVHVKNTGKGIRCADGCPFGRISRKIKSTLGRMPKAKIDLGIVRYNFEAASGHKCIAK